jgi:hypothetical protein
MGNHTQSPTLHNITSQKTIITTYALLSLLLTVMEESVGLSYRNCKELLCCVVTSCFHIITSSASQGLFRSEVRHRKPYLQSRWAISLVKYRL